MSDVSPGLLSRVATEGDRNEEESDESRRARRAAALAGALSMTFVVVACGAGGGGGGGAKGSKTVRVLAEVPREIIEAAELDDARLPALLRRVVMPVAAPGIATGFAAQDKLVQRLSRGAVK